MLEHWLLNLAIESKIPLTLLFPEWIEQTLNVGLIPGYTVEACADALLSLFERGLIEFSTKEPEDLTTVSGVRAMLGRYLRLRSPQDSRRRRKGETPEMRAQRMGPRIGLRVDFGLTVLGGAEWERLAEPDWRLIFTESTEIPCAPDAICECEIQSPDMNIIMARMGWLPELEENRVLIDTIKLETLSDHKILYWKRLPLVHRATFSFEQAEPRWGGAEPTQPRWYLRPEWFRDWWSASHRWYKLPWELADWPPE